MPKSGRNIYKRKDGRWEARYMVGRKKDGSPIYKSLYGKTCKEVKEKLNIQLQSNNKQISLNRKLFESLCEEWLESMKPKIKSSTYALYHRIVNQHVVPLLNNMDCRNINNNTINHFITDKIQHGRLDNNKALSSKTVQDIAKILLQIIRYGQKQNYIDPFDCDYSLPKKNHTSPQILSIEEQNHLIQYIKANLNDETLGILLSLFTGIRIGELCALTWGDINLQEQTIIINKTIQRIQQKSESSDTKTKIIIDTPKSENSNRIIPIPSFLMNALIQLKQSNDSYILTGKENQFIEPRSYQNKYKKYLKKASISYVNFHALRHTFATRALENGAEIKSISEILGHSKINFTLEKYVHLTTETKRINIDKLSVLY